MVVTELKVLPLGDKSPLGFLPLLHTLDDSKSHEMNAMDDITLMVFNRQQVIPLEAAHGEVCSSGGSHRGHRGHHHSL